MPKPVLYTVHLSPPCRAVELTAKALGLELERKLVNLLAGENLTPEFLKVYHVFVEEMKITLMLLIFAITAQS